MKINIDHMRKGQLGSSYVPLVSLDYKVEITGMFANISMNLEYKNLSNKDIECEFDYPLQKGLVLHKLVVTTKDKVVEGKIMPKEKAKKAYESAKVKGNQGFLIEEENDRANIKIGRISKHEPINVLVGLYKLCQVVDECWNLTLPLSIEHGDGKKSADRVFHSIEISICTDSQITRIFSKTHKINANYNESKNKATIKLLSESYVKVEKDEADEYPYEDDVEDGFEDEDDRPIRRPMKRQAHPKRRNRRNSDSSDSSDDDWEASDRNDEKDNDVHQFSLQFRLKDMKSPYILYEKSADLNEYAYAMCLTPSYCTDSMDSVKDEDLMFADATIQGSGEFIFMLDNSGSMSGSKLSLAKNALMFLIKSLPPNSIFNVIVFNSHYTKLNDHSCKYSQKNVASNLQEIENINAEGGTSLLKPLKVVNCKKINVKYPRTIYILTDGEVENRDDVLHEIKAHSKKTRVHMLGIGDDVDHKLIKQAAKVGRGYYKIVKDPKEINAAVINLLSHGVHPAYTEIKPLWSSTPLLSWPASDSIPTTYIGQPIYVAAIFDKPLEKASISYIDTSTLFKMNSSVDMANICKIECIGLSKIIAHNCIKSGDPISIEHVGIKYNILCTETALYAEIKSTNLEIKETEKVELKAQDIKKEKISKIIKKDQSDSNSSKNDSDDSSDEEEKRRHKYKKAPKAKANAKMIHKKESSDDEDLACNSSEEEKESKPKKGRSKYVSKKSDSNDEDDDGDQKIIAPSLKCEPRKLCPVKKGTPKKQIHEDEDDEEEEDIKYKCKKPIKNNEIDDEDEGEDEDEAIEKPKDKKNKINAPSEALNRLEKNMTTVSTGEGNSIAMQRVPCGINDKICPTSNYSVPNIQETVRCSNPRMVVLQMPSSIASTPLVPEEKKENSIRAASTAYSIPEITLKIGSAIASKMPFLFNHDELSEIIKLQELMGNWEITNVVKLLGVTEDVIFEGMPAQIKAMPKDSLTIWCTIVMLALLKGHYMPMKSEWVLIANKAISFIKKLGIKYEQYEETAKQLLDKLK